MVGSEPPTCPLACLEHPLVQEVFALHAALAENGGVLVDARSVPYVVAEGRVHLNVALSRARNERLERIAQQRREEAEAARRARESGR